MEDTPERSRRRLLATGALALLAPRALGQAARAPRRVGIAFHSTPDSARPYLDAFVQGMDEQSWRLERDYVVEARYAQGRSDRYPGIMGELLRAGVEVIVVGPNTGVQAAKEATSTVPIVMAGAADPEITGLVASLARPGGNVTGLAMISTSLHVKRVQLLREILPAASRFAFLVDPKTSTYPYGVADVEEAARSAGVEMLRIEASSADALDQTLATLPTRRPDALMVSAAILFFTYRRRIIEHCARQRLPSIYSYSEGAIDGGLLSYAANLTGSFRRTASYVARLLRGALPAELPVEQPTHFELIVNMKTARALGLAIPKSVLARADQLIE
jgi:putative ABC transport system substrate-binding protein